MRNTLLIYTNEADRPQWGTPAGDAEAGQPGRQHDPRNWSVGQTTRKTTRRRSWRGGGPCEH